MQVLTEQSEAIRCPAVVTIGKFDGFHAGHRKLLSVVFQEKKENMVSCVLSFKDAPKLHRQTIYTREEQQFLCASMGMDYLAEYELNEAFCSLMPEQFARDYLSHKLNAKVVIVGEDFRFGKDRCGDVSLLESLGEKYGFVTYVVSNVNRGGRRISSTLIRDYLLKGNIEEANDFLLRQYFVRGEVVHGKHLGNTIGFPTLNLIPPADKLLPKYGVYATKVKVGGMWFYGVTNVGVRPTVEASQTVPSVETNLLDCDKELYGSIAEVYFLSFLRPEQKFDSVDDLIKAISEDKEKVKTLYKTIK